MTRLRTAAVLGMALAIGAGVRLLPWRRTFTAQGVRFHEGDTDSHYHAARAARIASRWPRVEWVDRDMNYPVGARVPWPPLFDEVIATAAVVVHGGRTADVAGVAAVTPVAIGVGVVALEAALATALVPGGGWALATLLLALVPISVGFAVVGRPDQHVAEAFLSGLVVLAFVRSWRGGEGRRWRSAALMGAGIALAFWNWQGSGLYLLLLTGFAAAWRVWAPPPDQAPVLESLARGAGIGAALLGASLLAFAPGQLRLASLQGLTGFHLLSVAMAGAWAATAAWLARRGPAPSRLRRLGELGLAAVLPLALAAAIPGVRAAAARGLDALWRGNAWYASIVEFEPAMFSGVEPAASEALAFLARFGLLPVAMLAAAGPLRRRWREQPERRAELAFLALWGAAFLLLTLARRRFGLYLAAPMAILAALAVKDAAGAAARRMGPRLARAAPALEAAAALLLLAPCWPELADLRRAQPSRYVADMLPELEWLRDAPAPAGREAVMAEWGLGHAIRWIAHRPVVATAFGTDGGEGAMEDAAAVYHAVRPEVVEEVLARRRAGFLLVGYPVDEVFYSHPFAPPGTPGEVEVRRDLWRGREVRLQPPFWDLVLARLYFLDGGAPDRAEAAGLGSYRLVHESADRAITEGILTSVFKTYGVVPGAWIDVAGAAPGAVVTAAVRCLSNRGRDFAWLTHGRAGADGTARLRVPYATGLNGAVLAGPYAVGDGRRSASAAVAEESVAGGGRVPVSLGPGR